MMTEIMLQPNRRPVFFTTGVFPLSPQVEPAWGFECIPVSSPHQSGGVHPLQPEPPWNV